MMLRTTATPTHSAIAMATPSHIERIALRSPRWIRKAAMMPTIRAASTPSRSPITNVGSMPVVPLPLSRGSRAGR